MSTPVTPPTAESPIAIIGMAFAEAIAIYALVMAIIK